MNVIFTQQFLKQLQKIHDKQLAKSIEAAIVDSKMAKTLTDISHLKKLKGAANAFSIRIGDYRIGLYCTNNTVEFSCFMHRKEVYKFFP